MKPILIILFLILCFYAKSTEQRPDILIYKGDTLMIEKFPLNDLFQNNPIIYDIFRKELLTPDSTYCISSSCWRQYQATWKIENNHLFLIEIKDCCDDRKLNIHNIFPLSCFNLGNILANWYTGNLISVKGKLLNSKQTKKGALRVKYEYLYYWKIDDGEIKKSKVHRNY